MGILTKAGSAEKQWTITNRDTGESIRGQFSGSVEMEVRNNWRHHTALSRARAVTQFINSEVDRITLTSMFFALTQTDTSTTQNNFEKILAWAKPTQAIQRPPILGFSMAAITTLTRDCVIAGISDIKFEEPTSLGKLRQVFFTLQLDAYAAFNIDESNAYETRYHRVRERDYYEMLCWREYKRPILGDVIRKRHPDMAILLPGEIVKLPSVEAIQTTAVEPRSVALSTSFGRKDTPQRALRIDIFNRRDTKFVSHVVK